MSECGRCGAVWGSIDEQGRGHGYTPGLPCPQPNHFTGEYPCGGPVRPYFFWELRP